MKFGTNTAQCRLTTRRCTGHPQYITQHLLKNNINYTSVRAVYWQESVDMIHITIQELRYDILQYIARRCIAIFFSILF